MQKKEIKGKWLILVLTGKLQTSYEPTAEAQTDEIWAKKNATLSLTDFLKGPRPNRQLLQLDSQEKSGRRGITDLFARVWFRGQQCFLLRARQQESQLYWTSVFALTCTQLC